MKRFAYCVMIAATLAMSGCANDTSATTDTRDDADSSSIEPTEYQPRAETLLAVNSEASPVDLITATESETVSLGTSDDASFLLEATETDEGTSSTALADEGGETLLLDSGEVQATYERSDGDTSGTLTLLAANEEIIATDDDVTLQATEIARRKQQGDSSLDQLVADALTEWENGRWSAFVNAILELASAEGVEASSLETAYNELQSQLTTVEQLIQEVNPDQDLPDNQTARPNFYRVPDSSDAVLTNTTIGELFDSSVRNAFRSTLSSLGAELRSFSAGNNDEWSSLPRNLETYNGATVDTQSNADKLRFFANTRNGGEVLLAVTAPDGSKQDAASEVIFSDAADGFYRAVVTSEEAEGSVTYEILVFLRGRIINRLVGTLESNGDRGATLTVEVGESNTNPGRGDATDGDDDGGSEAEDSGVINPDGARDSGVDVAPSDAEDSGTIDPNDADEPEDSGTNDSDDARDSGVDVAPSDAEDSGTIVPDGAGDTGEDECLVSGYLNCSVEEGGDGDPDTCETDGSDDNQNCGACGNVCSTSSDCQEGGCEECEEGWRRCPGDLDGCETNIMDDRQNCGSCGNDCSELGVGFDCVEGECIENTCEAGVATCPGDSEPCSTFLEIDPENCGECGNDCSQVSPSAQCMQGSCVER